MNIVRGRIRSGLRRRGRRLWYRYAPAIFRRLALRRLRRPRAGKKHGLPGELIVSLTSFPPRFGTLHLTLGCLLDQTMKADRTILWIADADMGKVPAKVRELERRGLEIRPSDDLRSYKKLVPALKAFPDAFIATADDDLYYPADWLKVLVDGLGTDARVITCHRAHRVRRKGDGSFEPYVQWDFDVQDAAARQASTDILATAGAGALYGPHCLDPRVTDPALFQRLSPHGDDLWFYWCARMAGTRYRKVGPRLRLINWPGTQNESLWEENQLGRNDQMIASLEAEFPLVGQGT